jgi:hypothetical protein
MKFNEQDFTEEQSYAIKLGGFNNRCSICDCVDTISIAAEDSKFKPGLSFFITDDDRTVCSECLDEINENRMSLESSDEDEIDFMILDDTDPVYEPWVKDN